MRDYTRIDGYINKLYADIYPQPDDSGHTTMAKEVIDNWMSKMTTCHSVLDAGCGTGFCQPMFEEWNVKYEGICLGEDYLDAKNHGRNVKKMDFSFLDYEDNSFDLIFARHSLEHSPIPLMTLMEWNRVATNWLGLVVPCPEWFTHKGKNHYFVLNIDQMLNLLDVSGWKILWMDTYRQLWNETTGEHRPFEYRIMAEKKR